MAVGYSILLSDQVSSVLHYGYRLDTGVSIKFVRFRSALGPRPYHVGYTGSRPITEVKRRRARSVLGWVTAWEHRVPPASFFPPIYSLNYLFIYSFIHLFYPYFTYWSITYSSIYLFIHFLIKLSICLLIYSSIYPLYYWFDDSSINLFILLFIRLSIVLSIRHRHDWLVSSFPTTG